tara:strand:- start:164 stop:502 length:339 start_codon:yes stop_codon:yes gene_type:complete
MKEEFENISSVLTDEIFERQGWEMETDTDGEDDEGRPIEFYYWRLPLPKDNPDPNALCLVSSANDEYEELDIEKGEYFVEIENTMGLGLCRYEDELNILYKTLTKQDIEDKT